MDRKTPWSSLLLFTALLFGGIVRFLPALMNHFPLNDGGMFYVMVQDLQEQHYRLPQYTDYNAAGIPFAYPPLGLYMTGFLSDLLPLPQVAIFLWLPAVVNFLALIFFYQLAGQVLPSQMQAALAALFYALAPRSFTWQVMGGGVTRAFGMLFLLLMAWQAIQLFREYSHRKLLFVILFGAGAVLSHPQTALHAALGGALIFLFYGLNKRGFFSATLVAMGATLLTAPWWMFVVSRHGTAPFISAAQTSQRTLESYIGLLTFNGMGETLFLPMLLLAFAGICVTVLRREYFLVTWIVLAQLIDPRGGEGIALLPVSMLAAMGLFRVLAWLGRSDGTQEEGLFQTRTARILFPVFMLYLVLPAAIFDLQLVNTSLKPADLEMIDWVNKNTDDGKTFLLSTGREFSMSDPLQEWFPALTGQHSTTTMQGLEWTIGDRFFPWYEQVIAFQHCADVACVAEWSTRNRVEYDFLIVLIPPEGDRDELAESLGSLGISARTSALYLLVYETEHVMVFEYKKCQSPLNVNVTLKNPSKPLLH
jgi:hypothetical protein